MPDTSVLIETAPEDLKPFYCPVHGTVRLCPWRFMDCQNTEHVTEFRFPAYLALADGQGEANTKRGETKQ